MLLSPGETVPGRQAESQEEGQQQTIGGLEDSAKETEEKKALQESTADVLQGPQEANELYFAG